MVIAGLWDADGRARNDLGAQFRVRRQHTVEANQMQARRRHQCSQALHELQGRHHDGSVAGERPRRPGCGLLHPETPGRHPPNSACALGSTACRFCGWYESDIKITEVAAGTKSFHQVAARLRNRTQRSTRKFSPTKQASSRAAASLLDASTRRSSDDARYQGSPWGAAPQMSARRRRTDAAQAPGAACASPLAAGTTR